MRQFVFLSVISLCVLAWIGCSHPDSQYTKVEGTITYNQQPVEGANVTFLPVGGGTDLEPASGITDSSGKFFLTSSKAVKGGSGILPGEYVVLVSKIVIPADPDTEAFEQGTITYDELMARKSKKKSDEPKNVLPEKYSQRDKTDLQATVGQGKIAPLTFALTD